MNTPQQQADLFRKAAETIEMCAEHGITPTVKHMGVFRTLTSIGLNDDFCKYEWPIAVIEGRLVWAGDEIYFKGTGCAVTAGTHNFPLVDHNYTITKPKRTVMVEMLVEDAEYFTTTNVLSNMTQRMNAACRKALDNLNSNHNHNNLNGLQGGSERHSWNEIKIT